MSDVQYRAVPAAVADGAIVLPLAGSKGEAVVNIAIPVGGGLTWADKTITSLTGSSQTLSAALATRKALLIQNTGASNVGVNLLGGTAAVGGAGTLTLESLAIISLSGAECPVGAITVIGGAAQPLYCLEGT